MEETKKNTKGLIVLVIILFICVIGLGGYIVYDKLLNKPSQPIDNSKSTTPKTIKNKKTEEDSQEYTAVWTGTEFDLFDKASIDPNINFKDKKITIGKFDLTLNCSWYNSDDNTCDQFKISINEKENNIKVSLMESTYLIVVNDIVIISSGDYVGTMTLIDINGNIIFEKEIVLRYSTKYDSFNDGNGIPIIKDSKLYYYTKKDDKTIIKHYLDLQNEYKEVKVEELEGYIGEH